MWTIQPAQTRDANRRTTTLTDHDGRQHRLCVLQWPPAGRSPVSYTTPDGLIVGGQIGLDRWIKIADAAPLTLKQQQLAQRAAMVAQKAIVRHTFENTGPEERHHDDTSPAGN